MITHIVSDWLFSPCCVEHQDEFIFERVAVAYSRDYNEVGRVQIKQIIVTPGPEVMKLFSCSIQLRIKFILLLNVKMQIIVGRIND